MFDRTPLSGGTFAYSTFCHALSVALARATIRSLKPKLLPATSSEARNNGASTWCADMPAAFIATTTLSRFSVISVHLVPCSPEERRVGKDGEHHVRYREEP